MDKPLYYSAYPLYYGTPHLYTTAHYALPPATLQRRVDLAESRPASSLRLPCNADSTWQRAVPPPPSGYPAADIARRAAGFRFPHTHKSSPRRPRPAEPLRLPCTSSPSLRTRASALAAGLARRGESTAPRSAANPPETRAGDSGAGPYPQATVPSQVRWLPRPLGAAACLPARRAPHGKSRRRRAYPQQIVTTRLLYCLQDPFAHLSRLQRI